MLKILDKIFGKKTEIILPKKLFPPVEKRKTGCPLLSEYVGEIIEVYYLQQGKEEIEQKIARGILKFPPTEDFFYIGTETGGYHIIEFGPKDTPQGEEGVGLIKDKEGREIYRNEKIPLKL